MSAIDSSTIDSSAISAESLRAEGWESRSGSGFTGHVGPFWFRGEGDDITVGLLIEQRHCNDHIGTLHGGVVMTFADIGLGSGIARVMGEQRFGCVTVSLQTQFVAVARLGEFIYCKPEIVRHAKDLVFMRGLIKTGDKTIANADGIWKLMQSAK